MVNVTPSLGMLYAQTLYVGLKTDRDMSPEAVTNLTRRCLMYFLWIIDLLWWLR